MASRDIETRLDGQVRYDLLTTAIQEAFGALGYQGCAIGSPTSTLYFEVEPTEEEWTAIQQIYASIPLVTPPDRDVYRIYDLVDPRFQELPQHLIDFRRHLKEGITLEKDVTFAKNKRPLIASYTYNDGVNPPLLVARLRWIFEDDTVGLMKRRTEEICYRKRGETEEFGPYFVKLDQRWDILNSEYHRQQVLQERVRARQAILEDVKLVVMQTLLAFFPTKEIQEIYDEGGAFWSEHSNTLDAFVQVSSQRFRDVDLPATSNVTYPWLEAEVAPGVTLRAWIIDRLTY